LSEDIGSVLKGVVKVRQRQLVNEVLGPFVTEFVRNFGREGATPIQRAFNASYTPANVFHTRLPAPLSVI